MTTTTRDDVTYLEFAHSPAWTRGKSGMSVYRSWRSLHVSLYRKPNQPALRFRIDGELGLLSARDGMRAVWERALSRVGWTG